MSDTLTGLTLSYQRAALATVAAVLTVGIAALFRAYAAVRDAEVARLNVTLLERIAKLDADVLRKDVAIAQLASAHSNEMRETERKHDRELAELNALLVKEARNYGREAVKLVQAVEHLTKAGGG